MGSPARTNEINPYSIFSSGEYFSLLSSSTSCIMSSKRASSRSLNDPCLRVGVGALDTGDGSCPVNRCICAPTQLRNPVVFLAIKCVILSRETVWKTERKNLMAQERTHSVHQF